MRSASTRPTHNGVLLYSIAVLNLAMMDAAAKYLSRTYPTFEIVFFRSLFAFPPIFAYSSLSGTTSSLLTIPTSSGRTTLHLIRGVSLFFGTLWFVVGLRHLPLADVTAISMSKPIFVFLISAAFLRESARLLQWCGAALGFVAVIVVVQPTMTYAGYDFVFPLLSSVSCAAGIAATRALSRLDSFIRTSFYTNCLIAALSFPFALHAFVVPRTRDIPYVVLIGLFGGVSNILFAAALKQETSTRLVTLDYTILLWAAAFGFVLFGMAPSASFYAGAALLMVGGLVAVIGEGPRKAWDRSLSQST